MAGTAGANDRDQITGADCPTNGGAAKTGGGDMGMILIVEPNTIIAKIVVAQLGHKVTLLVVLAKDAAAAREAMNLHGPEIVVAVINIDVPGTARGEIVRDAVERSISTIVYGSEFSEDLREFAEEPCVVDYVISDTPAAVGNILEIINRIVSNSETRILIIDDSRTTRKYLSELLSSHKFSVTACSNATEALLVLGSGENFDLAVVDYNMPGMNGLELTKKIRETIPKEKMAVIGVSGYGNTLLSAKFLKGGGNDFINKPFLPEEFLCRVYQNIDIVRHMALLRDAASVDFLTGLYNRKHFMMTGRTLFSAVKRIGGCLAVAIIDADFFKRVNDTYGHDIGDLVLQSIASVLRDRFRTSDVVCRFGGEEFCVMLTNTPPDKVMVPLEQVRKAIEDLAIEVRGRTIQVTCSIGATVRMAGTLDAMIKRADEQLYIAKSEGRNCIRIDGLPPPGTDDREPPTALV
jgi:diguanylate cyclase (GGDEF)-like protein